MLRLYMSLLCLLISIGVSQSHVLSQVDQDLPVRPTVLLIDTSGSMDGSDSSGLQKIEAARNAAEVFVQSVAAEQQQLTPTYNDSLALINFDDTAEIRQVFTVPTDFNNLQSAIRQLQANGGTNMYSGFDQSIRLLSDVQSRSEVASSAIILLTDGMPTASSTSANSEAEYQAELLEIMPLLEQLQTCLYVIPIGDPLSRVGDDDYVDRTFLSQLITAAGWLW